MALIGGNLRKNFSDGDNLWQIGLIHWMELKMCWTQSWAFRCSRGLLKLFNRACLIDNIIECVLITFKSTKERWAIQYNRKFISYDIWSISSIHGRTFVHPSTSVHILIFSWSVVRIRSLGERSVSIRRPCPWSVVRNRLWGGQSICVAVHFRQPVINYHGHCLNPSMRRTVHHQKSVHSFISKW